MRERVRKVVDRGLSVVGKEPITDNRLPISDLEQPATDNRQPTTESGFTLLELIITLTVIAILAAGTIPIAKNIIRREKEAELRRNLRDIRRAIEAYKVFCDSNPTAISPLDRKMDDGCYPADLEVLVKGIIPTGKLNPMRFIRQIPNDPLTGNKDWGMRSVQDDPDSSSWGGQNLFDVYSKAPGTALNGSKYSDW